MPSSSPAGRTEPSDDRRSRVAVVAQSFVDMQRMVRRSKARLMAEAGEDIVSATQLLLRTVAADGPMRASALAVSVQSDVSTVSRQVAALVKRGLLERQADQLDGRASFLVVTDAGRTVIAEQEQSRRAFFDQVLSGWTVEELKQFAEHLDRFTAAYEETHAAWLRERNRGPRETVAAAPASPPSRDVET